MLKRLNLRSVLGAIFKSRETAFIVRQDIDWRSFVHWRLCTANPPSSI